MPSTTPELAELSNPDAYTWRPLRILGIYRIVIVAIIVLAFLGTRATPWMTTDQPGLFLDVALVYLGLSIVAYILSTLPRLSFSWQVYTQATLDVVGITLLIFASGNLDTGLGTLMVVAVAGASMLINMRAALFFAALATLLLLSLQVLHHLQTGKADVGYTQAALLGMTIFITAALSSLLSRRARRNQALADQRGHDLKSLEALNNFIVQRLDSGVVAVDPARRVRLLNAASWALLGRPSKVRDTSLSELSGALASSLDDWKTGRTVSPRRLHADGPEVALRFRRLGEHGRQGTLIFLENTTETLAKIQQAKLAALGQLSANIAHEIRNPLSAITHAAQLLEESPDLADGDKRLLTIILNQSARLNKLVQSVLQMSRRRPSERRTIRVSEFLAQLKTELREQYPRDDYDLRVATSPADLTVEFDEDHLRQVLTNLCYNAIVHGRPDNARLVITLRAYLTAAGAAIDVADNGKGVADDIAHHLFEPFFTTASNGTGLGLYLCQELCQSNGARLTLVPQQVGACFRVDCTYNDNEDE